MTKDDIRTFQKKIWNFYKKNKRDFPWRDTDNIYHILVSEIMLQQTQTSRVVPKYNDFLSTFPSLEKLSNASNTDVLRLWSGLGYNRRALYLKNAATHLCQNPQVTVENLLAVKGIGPNTAGSIYVFTTNKSYVFIETNIRRVYIHEFYKNEEKIKDKDILKLVEQTLDYNSPREWYYALMDYGSYLSKTEINPNRKSKHYKKQSKFQGSIRQVRGLILKMLLKDKNISVDDLKHEINSQHFDMALAQLEAETMIVINNGFVSIS